MSESDKKETFPMAKTPVSLLQELYVKKGITPKYDLVQVKENWWLDLVEDFNSWLYGDLYIYISTGFYLTSSVYYFHTQNQQFLKISILQGFEIVNSSSSMFCVHEQYAQSAPL